MDISLTGKYRILLMVGGVIVFGCVRLALDSQTDAYSAASTALQSSPAVRTSVGGEIYGTTLVGISNKFQTESSAGARRTKSCAKRFFIVRGEDLVFVEVTMNKAGNAPSWEVQEVLVGWAEKSKERCAIN